MPQWFFLFPSSRERAIRPPKTRYRNTGHDRGRGRGDFREGAAAEDFENGTDCEANSVNKKTIARILSAVPPVKLKQSPTVPAAEVTRAQSVRSHSVVMKKRRVSPHSSSEPQSSKDKLRAALREALLYTARL